MTPLFVLGAEAFAVEVVQLIENSLVAADYGIQALLALPGEEGRERRQPVLPFAEHTFCAHAAYVLGTSQAEQRLRLIETWVDRFRPQLPNFVHQRACADGAVFAGGGNLIFPFCYVGANVTFGRLNVLNACCSIGHHSRLGDNNFFAPNCHTGNSSRFGANNFLGVGVASIHEMEMGSGNRVQAGTALLEAVGDGQLVFVPARVKQLGLYGRQTNG